MKRSIHKRLSLLCVALLLGTLVLPSVALATEPDQIEVTIGAEEVTATEASESGGTGGDGAVITPDGEEGHNGYSYTNTNGNTVDVSLQGQEEDLVIVQEEQDDGPYVVAQESDPQEGDQNEIVIPNAVVTGAVEPADEAALNADGVYLNEYTGAGGAYTDSPGDFPAVPGSDGDEPVVDPDMVESLLDSNTITSEEGDRYLIEMGETTITGDKAVQEVTVTGADGQVQGYEVTLEVDASRTDTVFDASGDLDISGKTNIILTLDISSSMTEDLDGNAGSELDDDSRWAVLKAAAKQLIEGVYGIDAEGNVTAENADDIGVSLVVYSGGNSQTVARTITVSGTTDKVFGSGDVDDLLSYFSEDAERSALAVGDMLSHSGTNVEAGYVETGRLVDALMNPSDGQGVSAENIHVVFFNGGDTNSYYGWLPIIGSFSTSENNNNGATALARAAAVADEAALLNRGVSLHNVAITNNDTQVSKYMSEDGDLFEATQDTMDLLDDGKWWNDSWDYAPLYNRLGSAEDFEGLYRVISKQVTNDAVVAAQARIIDVVPEGFDVYFEDGNDTLRVVGYDDKGNTIIEWYIGDLENGVNYSTRYFLVPNSELGDKYTYGTAYTNESAVLLARPVCEGGEEIAIVLDRPAAIIDPYAGDDAVKERFTADFDFNVIDGTVGDSSHHSVYNLLKDSDDKLQAVGTTVSDTYIGGVTNARIAGELVPVTQKSDGSFVFETAKLRVVITPDGSVSYERLGSWPYGWGKTANVTFEYSVLFDVDSNAYVAGVQGDDQGVTLVGEVDSAVAGVNITLQKPKERDRDDDDDDDDAILIPLSPVIVDIPLGIPKTGGAAMLLYSGVTLTTLAGAAFTLLRRRKEN